MLLVRVWESVTSVVTTKNDHGDSTFNTSDLLAALRRSRLFFFFQAEDGIRDYKVTGVQTCALPIYMIMTQALGWALVDSLWQDALAAAGLAALLALVPVRAARIRYAFATLTLALMLALPLAPAVRLSGTSPQISDVVTATSPVTPAAPVADRIRAALEPALPWVVFVWFGGVVALSLRLASGWLVTRQLGRVGTSSVPDACREAVAPLAAPPRIPPPLRVLESGG